MKRLHANDVFLLFSLEPIYELNHDCVTLCCLPIDFDSDMMPAHDTRYVSLVLALAGVSNWDLFNWSAEFGAYASNRVTYGWVVQNG